MSRIDPAPAEQLEKYTAMFDMVEASMGFVPTSMKTMARVPEILDGFSALAVGLATAGKIDSTLSQLVAHITSTANGCRYCQAHTAAHAAEIGVDMAKIEAAWDFETSDLFSEAERAALRVARAAGVSPNEASDEQFADLAEHYDEEQIVHIVGVISFFGFLNRWNDTMATTLEAIPAAFGAEHLSNIGWEAGKHA